MKQFSKRLVVIHWITLLLFAGAYLMGNTIDGIEQAAGKLALYPYHFLGGAVLLLLTLVRAWYRMQDGAPAPLGDASSMPNRAAILVHKLLYALLIALPASGLLMIFQTGVFAAVMANDPSKLPDLEKFSIHEVHGTIANILLAVIVLHFLAALYHQFVLKDGLLRRMIMRRFPD